MRIGVVFPQTEIGSDVGAVRAYGETVEALGFAHVLVYDHVLGADTEVHKGWRGPYDLNTTFHEPFVLFGYLAGVTSLELVTGVIILPQRQTCSPEVGSASAWASAGMQWSTKPWARTSPTAVDGSRSRSN